MSRTLSFQRHALALAGLALLCLILLAGCGGGGEGPPSLEEIKEDGVIRVGVNPNFPPMSVYGRTNQLEGFDVDIARRVAEELGVELKLVPTEAAQRVPFLTSNRIDMTLGALTMTPERAAVVDFTIPLHTEAMSVLTTDAVEAETWRALDDPDITLVNMRGNRSVSILDEELPNAKKLLVDANADTVRAIAQGRADAMIENVDFFIGFTKNYPDVAWRVIDDRLFVAQAGIGVAEGNDSLREELNDILRELHAEGFVEDRWTQWYGGPMSAPVDLNYAI
jgi:polar amino acid transport system substrate-binding protein